MIFGLAKSLTHRLDCFTNFPACYIYLFILYLFQNIFVVTLKCDVSTQTFFLMTFVANVTSSKIHIRPKKINYMFLRHRPHHFQPPASKNFIAFSVFTLKNRLYIANCRIAKRSIAPPMLVTSLTAHVGPTNNVNTAVINMSDSMEIADGCSNFSPGRGSADLSSPGNLCEMLEYRYSKRHGENSRSERCSSRYFRSIFAVYPYTSPTSKSSCI